MQIVFYMAGDDLRQFLEYVFKRGGYIMPQYHPSRDVPIHKAWDESILNYWCFKIFKEDIFSSDHYQDPRWITGHPVRKDYYVNGPGMDFDASRLLDDGLSHGRIYMGLVSAGSFILPGEPAGNAYAEYREPYRKIENFYRANCSFIRKHYRKEGAGFYHGPGSDKLGVKKLN